MGVRVYSAAAGGEIEVSAEEAQRGMLSGAFKPVEQEVRVIREGNRTGRVAADRVATAVAEGWTVADDAQVEQAKIRREESDISSQALGLVEAGLAGASLGGTTYLADKLIGGDYSERARARQEGLGGLATAAEAAGGLLATIGTGGTGGVAQGAVRAGGLAARAGRAASLAGKAVAAPSRVLARAGAAAEGAIAGRLGGGLAGRAAGGAVRGVIEGAPAGAGSVIHESVLGDQPITAERLVGGFIAGGAFGGAVGAGIPLGAKLLEGAVSAPTAAVKRVLSSHVGHDVTDAVAEQAARGSDSWLSTAAEKLAPIQGADKGAAKRTYDLIANDSSRLHSILTRQKSIEAGIGSTISDDLTGFMKTVDDMRMSSQGAQKYRRMAERMPRNADDIAPRYAEKVRSSIADEIDGMVAANERHFGQAYDVPTTLKAQKLTKRAFEEMAEGKTAAAANQAMDRLKRDLGVLIGDTGGWGKPKHGASTAVHEANKQLRSMYKKVQQHLEREDVWGDAAVQQREMNGSFAASRVAIDELKGEGAVGLSKLFSADGGVNMRQAMAITRQYRRMGGEAVVNKLDAALEAQMEHLRVLKKHYDLNPEQLKRHAEAEQQLKRFRENMQRQAEDAAILDDLESLRESESARSVSMGAMSTLGPSVAGALGLGIGGLPGLALGTIAGGVMRPYTTARHLAALGDMAKGFAGKTTTALTPVMNAVRGIGKGVRRGVERAGKGAAPAAARAGVSRRERRERIDRARDNAVYLATQPGALAEAMAKTTEIMQEVAPGLAREMMQVTQRAALFLASKAPPVYQPMFSNGKPIVDPLQASRYANFVEAVTQPAEALKRIADGTFTAEHSEALKVVYPEYYADAQRQVTDAIFEAQAAGVSPPYSIRVKMANFLDSPVDEASRPERIATIQQSLGDQVAEAESVGGAAAAGNSGGGVRAKGGESIDATQMMTPAQRVATGMARA